MALLRRRWREIPASRLDHSMRGLHEHSIAQHWVAQKGVHFFSSIECVVSQSRGIVVDLLLHDCSRPARVTPQFLPRAKSCSMMWPCLLAAKFVD